ncbi:MAG: trigger factor, partial [Rhodobacteraceae bacterium]|nr:trigger factor [Paracoccaceae bacterium]
GDELEAKVNEKLEEARADFQMKGFRKGHAPLALMKKMFGKSVMGEAMQEAVDGAVGEHFVNSGDRPAMQPEIKMTNDEWKEGDDVAVSVTYECLPAIPDADFSKIKLERLVTDIEDSAVTEALENLAASTTNYEKRRKGSKAKDADQVVIDFLGKVEGEAFDGGAGEDYPLVLGSNSFIPGFEEQLVGAKEGDELDVNVTFPAEYGAEALAGKDAVFSCTVKEVREPKPAPVDEELAVKYGAESLEDLTKQITERLEAEYAGASRAIMKRKLMDELDAQVKFDLPPTLVKVEADQIAHQLWHDDNPDVEGHDHPEVETTDEHTTLAERRVRLGLLLAEIGNNNKVEVTEQEIQQAMFQQASQYPGQEREFFEYMQKNEQAQQQMRAPLYEDKVVDFIIELAEVSDKSISKDDLEAAIKDLDEA